MRPGLRDRVEGGPERGGGRGHDSCWARQWTAIKKPPQQAEKGSPALLLPSPATAMAAQGGPADPHDVQGYSSVPPEAEPRSRTASAPSPRRRARFDSPLPLSDLADASSTRSASPEPLATPSLSESYGTLKKNLSFKSLRELEIHELSAAVYRKGSRADRRVYRPKDSEEVFAHALRGGIRAFTASPELSAAIRSAERSLSTQVRCCLDLRFALSSTSSSSC